MMEDQKEIDRLKVELAQIDAKRLQLADRLNELKAKVFNQKMDAHFPDGVITLERAMSLDWSTRPTGEPLWVARLKIWQQGQVAPQGRLQGLRWTGITEAKQPRFDIQINPRIPLENQLGLLKILPLVTTIGNEDIRLYIEGLDWLMDIRRTESGHRFTILEQREVRQKEPRDRKPLGVFTDGKEALAFIHSHAV